jgi:mannose-6-phosphate isomerase
VHPAKHEAEVEFARENREKIPIDAPHRNYKDDNHKPELMVALGDFYALHGFKPVEELRDTLIHTVELTPLLEIFDSTGYDQLYKTAMEIPQDSVDQLAGPLLDRIIPLYLDNKLSKDQEDFWAARAALTFNNSNRIDRGIFSIYFFNLLHLSRGQGIFQDAGVPHAYLEGQNVEIMANSDNVLRGGLTHKHIDVKELMKHVRFEETVPNILTGEVVHDHEHVYRTPAPDFKLSSFWLETGESSRFESMTGEIVFILTGSTTVQNDTSSIELCAGESAFIDSHQKIAIKAKQNSELYRASAPTANL